MKDRRRREERIKSVPKTFKNKRIKRKMTHWCLYGALASSSSFLFLLPPFPCLKFLPLRCLLLLFPFLSLSPPTSPSSHSTILSSFLIFPSFLLLSSYLLFLYFISTPSLFSSSIIFHMYPPLPFSSLPSSSTFPCPQLPFHPCSYPVFFPLPQQFYFPSPLPFLPFPLRAPSPLTISQTPFTIRYLSPFPLLQTLYPFPLTFPSFLPFPSLFSLRVGLSLHLYPLFILSFFYLSFLSVLYSFIW